jgi:predicted transcriptional regulator
METPTIPKMLEAIMIRERWNQKRLAEELGVTQPMISGWVTGKRKPRLLHVADIRKLWDTNQQEMTRCQTRAAPERVEVARV